MSIYRDDNGIKREKMSDWLSEFAEYWEKAEKRVKKADYLSEIQRALVNKGRNVEDVVSEMKERVGLNMIEDIRKESESDVDKKALYSDAPELLQKNEDLLININNKISSNPYVSFEAIQSSFNYPPELESEEVKDFIKKIIQNAREGLPKEPSTNNYNVDSVDTLDNRDVAPGQMSDGVNKI